MLADSSKEMGVIERFGQFDVSHGADGRAIELARSPDELVFLAFDTKIKRLVELHVPKNGTRLQPDEKAGVHERARLAAFIRRRSLIRILDCGEVDGVVYYSTSLNDGEAIEAYVARRGALPQAVVFSLLLQLLDDLIALQSIPRLFAEVRLEHLFVSLQEDTFLQLFVSDYGLLKESGHGAESEHVQLRLVDEACLTLFLLLTGQTYAGEDCDRAPALTSMPTGLRIIVRSSLTNPSSVPCTLARMRDAVRDALMAQTRDLQGRNSRRHLIATDDMLPQSGLREILLHDVPMNQLQKANLVLEADSPQKRYPFTLQAADARTEVPVTIHLLPPRRILSTQQYDAVPLQMWRFNDEQHPNIIRSRSVWESPDLTFLTEERRPGFPLSRLISERVYLNASEVLIIIRQVKKGIDQALECRVGNLDLHPSNITLRLIQVPPAREMEKLLQKRLDAWPKFLVMLRPHMTMRSLFEPLLVDPEAASHSDEISELRKHCDRALVALTAYLLSGERQLGAGHAMPDSVPEPLAEHVVASLNAGGQAGAAPAMNDFIAGFEKYAAIPEMETEGGSRPPSALMASMRAGPSVPVEEMESAGSVSDFDDDDNGSSVDYLADSAARYQAPASGKSSFSSSGASAGRNRFSMALWAGVVAVIMAIALLFFFVGKLRSDEAPSVAAGVQPVENRQVAPPVEADANSEDVTGLKADAELQPNPTMLSKSESLAEANSGKTPLTKEEEVRRALLLSKEEKAQVLRQREPNAEKGTLTLGPPDDLLRKDDR